jgi:phosphate transport system substrate-binding protein
MPVRTGKCINFGLCSKADSRELITIAEGEEFVCPEDGKPLQPVQPQRRAFPVVPVGVALAIIVIAILVYVFWPKAGQQHAPVAHGSAILRLSGSNTIGAQLAPALAEGFLRSKGAADIKRVPGAQDEVTVQATLPGETSPSSIQIAAHGSATAFADLHDKKCDIGNASRRIKPSEADGLAFLGDMTSAACEHVLGLDGVAVIVNVNNPIRFLTKEQIRRIFSGEFTNWSQVSRPEPGVINVYVRDEKSGTRDTFQNLVMGGDPPPKGQGTPLISSAQTFEDSRQLSDSVAGDPNGIGFVGYPYVRSAKAVPVSEAGARPLLPSPLTISTEDYPLSRRLYLYTAANPENPMVREYVRFALSPAGQEIVASNEFVAQIPKPVPQQALPDAPENYRSLTAGADRLPLDFRFRSGSRTLDNKALDDIDRVVAFVSSSRYSGQKIVLLGFADSSGSRPANDELSKDRAAVVSEEFRKRGVQASVATGFGSELPVASNDTPEGREKNRRVEIWLKK